MNPLIRLVQNIREKIALSYVRNRYRMTVKSALIGVARVHPEYNDIGFDEHFLNNKGAKLIQPFLEKGRIPTPQALAAAWATQYRFSAASQKRAIANIMPMVTDFVYLLTEETASVPAFNRPTIADRPTIAVLKPE